MSADVLLLDREDADFRIDDVPFGDFTAAQQLIVPGDVVEFERNLLVGLELDDVRDLLAFDRRQLDHPCEPSLARHREVNRLLIDVVARKELLESGADQFIRLGVRLAQNLGVFDEVKRFEDRFVFFRRRRRASRP